MLEIDRTLEAWAAQGDTDAALKTHADIRVALGRNAWPYGVTYEVLLIGGFATGTNTTDDGVVDIACELTSTFVADTSALTVFEVEAVGAAYPPKPFGLEHLREEVAAALRATYGAEAVAEEGPYLRVARGRYNLEARVLPCVEHRRYLRFVNVAEEEYETGVSFRDGDSLRVWHPGAHLEAVSAKDHATDGWFLRAVRLVKRAAASLPGATPWHLEGLLANVPDEVFGFRMRETVEGAVRWLGWADLASFRCADGRTPLFGPDGWSVEEARAVVAALADLVGVRRTIELDRVITLDDREQQPS